MFIKNEDEDILIDLTESEREEGLMEVCIINIMKDIQLFVIIFIII